VIESNAPKAAKLVMRMPVMADLLPPCIPFPAATGPPGMVVARERKRTRRGGGEGALGEKRGSGAVRRGYKGIQSE